MKTVAQTVIEADRFYTIAAKGGSVIQAVEKATNGGDIRLGKYEHKPEQEWAFVREGDGVGVGMMTRGEVALIVAQKGLDIGVVDSVYFTAVILLIVVSSVATPLVLKALFTKMPVQPHPSQAKQ